MVISVGIVKSKAEYVGVFNDRGCESCGRTEQKLTDLFKNMENLRILNVFVSLNISSYKEIKVRRMICLIQLYQAVGSRN